MSGAPASPGAPAAAEHRPLTAAERLERAEQAQILNEIPRRARLTGDVGTRALLRRHEIVLPEPRLHRVLARAARFVWALLVFAVAMARDKGPREEFNRRLGVRVRELFERLGGTALKIGQQLAIRVDFLPFELCDELGKLMDRVTPFEAKFARERIEAVAGAPMREVFESFDEVPIGSASIACVFRGRLKTGEEVAVKVRRPGVEETFVIDLALIGAITRLIEALTIVRPNAFKAARTELKDLFLEELDFHREANFTTLFRVLAKRDRLSYVTAPRVLHHLSGDGVLTTEFVHGFSCVEVMRAVDTRDEADLETLRKANVEPKLIGERVMELSFWMCYECPFFHSDPHPGNMLILPDNRIAMLDFGACGLVTAQQTADQVELTRRIGAGDISGAAQVLLNTLAPLPDVDIARLRKALEVAAWKINIMMRAEDAPWWERTTAAISMTLGDALKEFNVPINITQLRISRATLLWDTVAYRLHPRLDYMRSYRRWVRRSAIRAERRRDRSSRGIQRGKLGMELASLAEVVRSGAYVVNTLSRDLPEKFVAFSGNGALVGATFLRVMLALTLLSAAFSVVSMVTGGFDITVDTFVELFKRWVKEPVAIGAFALIAYFGLRKLERGLAET